MEPEFRQRLANFVTDYCNANIGRCANRHDLLRSSPNFFPRQGSTDSLFFSIIRSLSSDPDLINILPRFPIKNSPLKLKFYVRLKAGRDQHVTIDSDVTVSIFQAFARNLSDAFGVEFTGMCVKLLLF